MRSLIVVTILCLTSTPAFACVFDTDCKPGTECHDGACSSFMSTDDDNNVPSKPANGKTCYYDSECREGSRCIKGTGMAGICIGGH